MDSSDGFAENTYATYWLLLVRYFHVYIRSIALYDGKASALGKVDEKYLENVVVIITPAYKKKISTVAFSIVVSMLYVFA